MVFCCFVLVFAFLSAKGNSNFLPFLCQSCFLEISSKEGTEKEAKGNTVFRTVDSALPVFELALEVRLNRKMKCSV